jgi:hypothetical protein
MLTAQRLATPVLTALVVVLLAACAGDGGGDDEGDAAIVEDSSGGADSPPLTGEWYVPAKDATWQWQLSGPINTGYDVDIYDIDLFDAPGSVIDELHAAGRKVVCYFSAGSAEDWRPDYGDYPSSVLGAPLDGWEGEVWVDIRSTAVRAILSARLDLARQRGCDAVEPDNVTAYDGGSGFDIDMQDQIAFIEWLAGEAHARDLGIALKNAPEILPDVVDQVDFGVIEECHEFGECDEYKAFADAGKAALVAEYADSEAKAADLANTVCPASDALGLRTLILPLDLDDDFRVACF